MSMRSSVGRRKPTSVKRYASSKPVHDSESDSESLPDVLRDSKSRSVSEEEEKENKRVMSETDGGQRSVKSLRSRSRKQRTTKRIPQKTSLDLSESQTDIFESLSDVDHLEEGGSTGSNQNGDISPNLQEEAKIVAGIILEKEKTKSSAKTNANGIRNNSAVEEEASHVNGVDGGTDAGSVKLARDTDEDGDNIPKSRSVRRTRAGAKTSSKEKSREGEGEVMEVSTGEGEDETEMETKDGEETGGGTEDGEDGEENGGGMDDEGEKSGGKISDEVSKTIGKGKNITENGNTSNGDESTADGDSQRSSDEVVLNKHPRTSRRKQAKEKIQKVEEDEGEMESVEDTEEESGDDGSSDDEEWEERDERNLRRRKNQRERKDEEDFLQDFKGIRCTSCYQQLNQYNRKSLCKHPTLDVLVCRRCIEYYHEGDFTKDEEGADEQCQWCGEGGNLICCDFCSSAFCKTCICRNISRKEWTDVSTNETSKWKCYVCNKKPISDLIKSCRAAIKWAEKSSKSGIAASKPTRRDYWAKETTSKSYKQLCTYLEGKSEKWNFFQSELEKKKKSISQMKKKELLCAIMNIRSFRKYLKSYQNHFEQSLEEIMSSGEISGGETATDSMTAKEDAGLKENGEADEKEGKDGSSDDEEMTTPKKKGKPIRRIKTTPKRNSTDSDREKLGDRQIGAKDQDSSDDGDDADDDATTQDEEEEDDDEMKVAASGDETQDNSEQKEKGNAEATDGKKLTNVKKTRKASQVKEKVDDRKEKEKALKEEGDEEEDADAEKSSDKKDGEKADRSVEEQESSGDEEDDAVSLIDDDAVTEGTKDRKKQMNKDAGKAEGSKDGDGSVDGDDESQTKAEKEKDSANEGSPDERSNSAKDEKLVQKNKKGKKDKEVVDKDEKLKEVEAMTEEENGGEEEVEEEEEDFEKMLMDDMESNEEEDVENDKVKSDNDKVNKKTKKATKKKDSKSENESSDKEVKNAKTSKTKVKARKSLSEDYKKDEEKKSKAKTSKYVETGSTSDTEVSLIDLDIADEQERKRKKLKKRPKKASNSDSDTDMEVEKLVHKATKRKKKLSGDDDSQQEEEKVGGIKKERGKSSSKKRRRKGSSGSDIDSEIDRLDDLNFGSDKKGKGRSSKQQPAKPKVKKEKNKKTGKESSSSDDSDEELPEINYDTDPEIVSIKNIKLEDAEEQNAEEMLVKELENDEKDKDADDDSSSDSEGDEDGEKKKKSKGSDGKEGKGDQKNENGKKESKKKASEGSDDDQKSSQSEKSGNKKKNQKVHKLLKGKLISSSSSSDSGEEWGKKKKKLNEMLKKEGKSSESGKKKKNNKKVKKKSGESDSDFTISSDSSVEKKKNKRNKSQSSEDESESSDDSMRRRRISKRKRKKSDSESNEGSSDNFARERKKLRSYQQHGKEKKKSRIKQAFSSGSDSEVVGKKQKGDDDLGSDFEESPEKGKGRKKIRKLMKKKELAQETIDAAEEERERRKRVQKKRQEIIAKEMDSPQKSSILQEIILDRDPETNEVLLEIDKELVKVLKPHQAKGIQFMWDCTFENLKDADKPGGGCILAHCMGLGKTLQVIAFLHAVMLEEKTGVETALVVAPLNTVLNWEAEFEKWQDGLDYEINVFELASYKDNASRADVLKQWKREGGVMIMGYTMYRNLCQSRFVKKKKQKEVFAETLVNPGPDLVVCDEGHLLKNDTTATAIAMNNIRTKRRICLTGTPLQNNLVEYHCMVQFVKPMLLGTRKEFCNRFANPINNGQCADSSPYDVKLMKKRAHILHNLLSGSVQRKDYSALAPYLPPKHEFVILIRLSKKQIELYERYLENYGAGSGGGALEGKPTSLFKDYQVLMNVWTHPRLLKLAEIRTEKKRQSEEIKTFIDDVETEVDTSEEEEVVEHVRDSSSEDEIMQAAKEKKLVDLMNVPGTSGEQKNGRGRKKADSGDSDSSVEVIKTWNTRRTRGDGEDDFMEEFVPPPPKKQWFTDLVDDEDDLKIEISGKMLLLFEILKLAEAVGEKVLLFSQSLLTLDLIEDLLEDQALKNVAENAEKRHIKLASSEEIEIEMETYDTWVKGIDYFRIDGSTEAHTRKAMSDKFNNVQNIRSRLFLVSTRAGSLGINLVAASRVIIFDACWNPSHDIQSIFRVYRFGQEKAVYIYRFIAQGTMEERIYDRQVTKQSLAQRVVDEHQVKRHYTFTELNELYNFQPDRLDDPNRKEQPTPILPKDFILAELLHCQKDWIVNYHEHDSLLENVVDESLTEEERKAAWAEYEAEKEGRLQMAANPGLDQGMQMADQLRQMQQRMPTFNHGFLQRYAQPSQYPHNAGNPSAPFMSMARILQMSNQVAQRNQGNRPQLPGSSYSVRIPGIPQPVITHRIPPPSMNFIPGVPRPGMPGQTRPSGPGPRHGPPLPGASSMLMQALSRHSQEKANNPSSSNHVIKIHPGTPQPPTDGEKKK